MTRLDTRVNYFSVLAAFLLMLMLVNAQQLPIMSVSSINLTRPDWGNHNDIDISPNGLLVAVATDNGAYVLGIDLNVVAVLEGHLGNVYSVHWHPDGTRLASGGEDGTIRIWDMVESSPSYLTSIQTIQDTGPIYFVGWSPNSASNQIATRTVTRREAASDSIFIVTAIRIWNTQTGQIERTLGDLANGTMEVAWNSDGTLLAGGGAIDPDGYRLVVWNAQDGSIVATSDAQIDPLRSVAWQPNTSVVAATDVSATWLFDTSTSQPISYVGFDRGTWRLTAVDWNADGSQFATGSYANYLLVYDAANGQVVLEFDNSPDFVYTLDWGVSGSKIAAIVGKHTIRIYDVDELPIIAGTPTITPIPTLTPDFTLTPSPTRTPTPLPVDKLAVSMIEAETDTYPQLFTIDLNGTNVTRLTDSTEFSRVESPSWSPDGTKIVFAAALPQESTLQIFVANADGSNALQLTDGITPSVDPSWSPDGRWIVFTSEQQGNKDIFATKSDGSTITSPIQITTNPADDFNPEWTISGRIVFVSNRDRPSSSDIYTVGIDGANTIRITNTSAFDEHPTWSPDGQRIAFSAQSANLSDIYVVNADGSNARVVTQNANAASFGWSPDGSQIVYSGNDTDLRIVDTNTLVSIVLYSNMEEVGGVSWARGQGRITLPTPTPSSATDD